MINYKQNYKIWLKYQLLFIEIYLTHIYNN